MDTRTKTSALGLVCAVVLLTACTPGGSDPAPSSPSEAASPTVSADPAADYAVPDVAPDEIGRAVFIEDGGEGGIPETTVTATDKVRADVPFRIEGDCVGDRVDFRILTAGVDDSGDVLESGTIVCGEGAASTSYSSAWEGPVQAGFVNTDDVSQAWVRLVPAG